MPKKVAASKKKTPVGTKKKVAVKRSPKKMPPMPTGKGSPMSMPMDTDMDMM